jgi:hypothetical protein
LTAEGGELVQEPRDTVYVVLVKVTHIAVPSVTARCCVCRSVDSSSLTVPDCCLAFDHEDHPATEIANRTPRTEMVTSSSISV